MAASPVDPLEPLSLHAAVHGWAGDSLTDQGEGLDLFLGTGNRQRQGQAVWRASLGGRWSMDALVVGSDHPNARGMQGSTRTKGGWSGRLMRGLVMYRSSTIDVDLGRDRLGTWTGGYDDPALGLGTPPVDLGRLALKLPRWNIRLETLAAALPAEHGESGFQRWLGGHEIRWERGMWSVGLGDLVVYTGLHRGLEPAYLNPFLPAFAANFEDVAEVDTLAHRDNDNNLLRGTMQWRPQRDAWHGRLALDLVVDEFQMDQDDRDDMDDVWGVRLAGTSTWEVASGLWQLGFSASQLSNWLYQHPGIETDWSVNGLGLGHPAGGDLQEARLMAAWLPPADFAGWRVFWADGSGLRVESGLRRKGAIQLADPWDPTATVTEDLPSDPELRSAWLLGDMRVGWRLSASLRIQAWLTGTAWLHRQDGDPGNHLEGGFLLGWTGIKPVARP